jgi:type III pantothenate kinase
MLAEVRSQATQFVPMNQPLNQPWLALAIGNSRLHWALEMPDHPRYVWHTPHLSEGAIARLIQQRWTIAAEQSDSQPYGIEPDRLSTLLNNWHQHNLPLWMAAVMPEQAQRWLAVDRPVRQFALSEVPLRGLYPTLGIDRALALWGLLQRSQTHSLVIDAGTALTISAATAHYRFIGGAIAPGVSLQLRSLATDTAALPDLSAATLSDLPSRWAMTTQQSIYSGIGYTLLGGIVSFISDWQCHYPNGAIALTGGDSQFLHRWLCQVYPEVGSEIQWMPELLVDGMRSLAAIEQKAEI